MLQYLKLTSEYPSLRIAADIIYYSLISIAILFALTLIYKRLGSIGYDKKKIALFAILSAVITLPAAYIGTRAAAIFYKPISNWSIDLLIEAIHSGTTHTFHAGLILTFFFISLLTILMRFKYFEAMDAIFLYVPMGYAIGRTACLIVGCCWGRYVTLDFLDIHVRFPNPVPLYAIGASIFIFVFLRRLYEIIYSSHETRERYRGSVFASYFVLYGTVRIILEIFRKERRIGFGLTQAQAMMIFFIIAGLILFLVIWCRRQKKVIEAHTQTAAAVELRKLFLLGGFLATYLALFFVIYYLTKKAHVLQWPFRKAETVAAAYIQILYYIPFTAVLALSLYWLEKSGAHIWAKFRWNRFSNVFYAGLAFSILYTIYLLVLKEPRLRGLAYWPPVVVLSIMNAVSEELVYRFAAFNIFMQADYSKTASIIAQSLLYSLIHFMMGGPILGIFSILYGIILGLVMDRADSVTPCIICHFAIDIGCIGLPMLSY